LIAGIIFLILRRNKKRREQRQQQQRSSERPEVPYTAPSELPSQDIKPEIYTKDLPWELGGKRVCISPAELHGDGAAPQPIENSQLTDAEKR
jgi:hypothetical protein